MSVKVSTDYGIVIRKSSLQFKQVSRTRVCEIMEADKPLDEDEELLSFGPHFGWEAAREFISRLQKVGLIYYEDFFDFSETVPQWCNLIANFEG